MAIVEYYWLIYYFKLWVHIHCHIQSSERRSGGWVKNTFFTINMQWANQTKSTGSSSLGNADFDCKYSEHVSLINLALFILNFFFPVIGISLCILWLAWSPEKWICVKHELFHIKNHLHSGLKYVLKLS